MRSWVEGPDRNAERSSARGAAEDHYPRLPKTLIRARHGDCSLARMKPSVMKVLCASDVLAGDGSERTLSAAQCGDGTFRLLLDGKAMDGRAWRESELADF